MVRHEHPGPTLLGWTLPSQSAHLTAVFHTVVLEHEHWDAIVLVLDLLGSGVVLLLPLLGPSPKPQHQVQGGLLLDVVVRQCPTVLQLLPSKDQSLLVRRDSFLVLNLGLNILDGVRWLDLKSVVLPVRVF